MHTAIIHPAAIAIEKVPVYFSVNEIKVKRYTLCLEMVGTILNDLSINKRADTASLFHTLGQIAYCVDSHLDDLSLEQKEKLFVLFPGFFDTLSKQAGEKEFNNVLRDLCDQLNTSLYPPSLCIDLFRFYDLCKKHDLLQALKTFSITVVEAAILKCRAKNANEILKSLELEGNAAVSFLLKLLQKENLVHHSQKNFKKTRAYLSCLEKMLNVADDLYDHKKDAAKGIITLKTGISYYFILSRQLLKLFFTATFRYNFLFFRHFIVFTHRYIRSEFA